MNESRATILASGWTISTDAAIAAGTNDPARCVAAGVDEYLNLIRVTSSRYTYVARFRLPFTYTLTPQ